MGSLRSQKISAVDRKTSENITFIDRSGSPDPMAKSKTGSFTLTERINSATAAAGIFSGTIDLGAYVDVGDQQAIAIESVDFVVQAYETDTGVYSGSLGTYAAADCLWDMQLSDLNPGDAILPADDQALIAAGVLAMDDTNLVFSLGPDLYPDNFGKLDEARMVVNDQLYFLCDASTAATANDQWTVTCRIRCRIVKLSTKDWMAIAIQSTAADN